MPTFALLIRLYLARERGGASAVEFALMVPMLMLAVAGVTELGGYFQQTGAVEKCIRSAAMYAARSELPLSNATLDIVKKIARTGVTSGGTDQVSGWADVAAKVDVTVSEVTTGGVTVSVVAVAASLPYTPIVPVFDELISLRSLTITATHEQVYIGG